MKWVWVIPCAAMLAVSQVNVVHGSRSRVCAVEGSDQAEAPPALFTSGVGLRARQPSASVAFSLVGERKNAAFPTELERITRAWSRLTQDQRKEARDAFEAYEQAVRRYRAMYDSVKKPIYRYVPHALLRLLVRRYEKKKDAALNHVHFVCQKYQLPV